jgi:hypothetical protein
MPRKYSFYLLILSRVKSGYVNYYNAVSFFLLSDKGISVDACGGEWGASSAPASEAKGVWNSFSI